MRLSKDNLLGSLVLIAVVLGEQYRQDLIENSIAIFTDNLCTTGQIQYGNTFTGHKKYVFSSKKEEIITTGYFREEQHYRTPNIHDKLFAEAREEKRKYCTSF